MSEDEKISIEWLEKITEINKKDGVENSCAEILLKLIKKLQKENEEVKRLIAHKNEYTKKLEEDLFENAENYVIPVQKVKDRIEKYKKLSDKFYVKFLESDRYNTDIREKGIKCDAIILALEELIEERGEKNHGENI